MEDPLYGNGSGVQIPFAFEAKKESAQAEVPWVTAYPYHFRSVGDLIEAWAYCTRRRLDRPSDEDPLSSSLKVEWSHNNDSR